MNRNARLPIRSIAVLGGGPVGLTAALAFSHALPGVEITLVVTPSSPATLTDRLPGTSAPADDFLQLIGVEEGVLVTGGAATHRLAQRFAGWRADGGEWIHGLGETGAPVAGGPFHQRWLAARRAGSVPAFHRYSPAAVLAAAGRFVHPVDDAASPLSRFDYALRLDPDRAPPILARIAQGRGVRIVSGSILSAERGAGDRVEAVRLDQGRTLCADLIVDCVGASGGGVGWDQDWNDALPCDRLLLAVDAATEPSPCDAYLAVDAGWRGTWPLSDRGLRGFAYASAMMTEARARRTLGTGGDRAELLAFAPGRRATPWRGNVLMLGDAAVVAGPLGWPGLGLVAADLALALALLPGRDFHAVELAEYNRRAGLHANRVRDFLALHYLAGGRRSGEFWRTMRDRVKPAGLAQTLQQFTRRGLLPHHEEEGFDRDAWLAVLLGLDIVPDMPDPALMGADTAAIAASLARIEAVVGALPARLPLYRDYLAHMARAA